MGQMPSKNKKINQQRANLFGGYEKSKVIMQCKNCGTQFNTKIDTNQLRPTTKIINNVTTKDMNCGHKRLTIVENRASTQMRDKILQNLLQSIAG